MTGTTDPHPDEQHAPGSGTRLNWLRAGVLGANDGIVSTAGIVVGVAAATTDRATILTAGVAGLLAGALSMAAGEYVSVSTQRDTERALLAKERWELTHMPEEELAELAGLYEAKGLDGPLAHEVAVQLTAHDPLGAHAETELGIDPHQLARPWQAAWASCLSFSVGALLPLVAIELATPGSRVLVCFVAVVAALVLTGVTSARLGGAARRPAVVRNVVGGVVAMVVTYGVGRLIGGGLV